MKSQAAQPQPSGDAPGIAIAVVDIETLARNWWVVLLRGLAAFAFGIITFVAPGISLAALVLLFGAYAFADGVLALVSAFLPIAFLLRGTFAYRRVLLAGG